MRSFRLVIAISIACRCFAAHPDWQSLRNQIDSTLHVRQPLPNVEAKFYGKFSPTSGVDADRVSYTTEYELRVPAIVYHPAGATLTKHPALIVVNGHGEDKSSWDSYWAGMLYARAGAVVLTYDPIGEYERNKERRSHTLQHDQTVEPQEKMARRMTGLMITDVMQAVSYLSQRPDVDAKRIAVMGFSMGSFIGSLECALDTRVHACVLAGGGNLDGPGGHWDTTHQMCESIAYQSLKFLGDRGAVLYALNAKRGPTLVLNGSADGVEDIPHHGPDFFADLRKRTIAELGSSKDVFDFDFFPGGGHAPYFLTRRAALWLNDKLKFPDWTKKQIEQMPEMRVQDWAAANQLVEANLKSFQQNAGPLMALGNDIPAVPRADLHAIPEAVWDSQERSYIYETWVDRESAAAAAEAP
jgi:dienelactone hydrolase